MPPAESAHVSRTDAPRPGPAPAWLGRMLEPVYRAAVRRRNARFDRGEDVRRFTIPVISIGNLSVGGTGKTPMVAHIVRLLIEQGRKPAIVMRGYKKARGTAAQSDEQAEYLDMFGDAVPVLADPDRCRSIAALERNRSADAVVMDDGFQHRRVHRDLDIVLLDATRDVFTDRLLPRGWLREPVESLSRAHVIVLTHAEAVSVDARESSRQHAAALAPNTVWCEAEHAWSSLSFFGATADATAPPEWLNGRTVILACGIGNPDAFERQCKQAGARIIEKFIRPDHHHWSLSDVRDIQQASARAGAACVLTTMKDWVKLRAVDGANDLGWAVPRLSMNATRGADELSHLIRRVTKQS
ncbi:MAG: tetraacyldisaccharide 4'-kinase [Phycisphaerales bacterium]